jgi:hypothetical protein
MDQIYPDNGLVAWLKAMVTPSVNYHLYTNNHLPGLSDTISTYTEAAWSGYAAISVADTAFTFTQVTAHVGAVQAPNISFTNTSGSAQSVYGYFVTDSTNTYLLAAAQFDGAPISIPNGNAQAVTPLFANYSALTS